MAGSYWNKNSMLHQTLGSPFLQFHHHVSAAAAAAPAKVEPASDGVEAAALKKARRHEAALPPPPEQGGFLGGEMEWAVERGGALLGDDFSVDDLLDFEGLDTEFYDEEEDDSKSFAFAFQAEEEKSNSNTGVPAAPAAAPPLAEINLPAHDAAEFEWMTSIMEDDTVPAYPVLPVAPYRPASGRAPAAPAPSLCRLSTEDLVPVKAKRSRRPRTMGNPWLVADSSTSSSTTTTTTSSTSSAESSYLVFHHPPLRAHPPSLKKRGRKPKPSPAAATAAAAAAGERRCTHCGSQKTPQWRAGPSGPKTLCNACGVRFKSGRLVPEYRPAASPTFVSHVHSNSHRKVLEMRRKKEERALAAITSF